MEPTAAGTYSESLLSIAPQNASCSPCLGVRRALERQVLADAHSPRMAAF